MPIPCYANWQISQMFQTTPYLQQCVKLTVEAKSEFFFMMTEKINDKHSWIYVHQQRESLCLHRLGFVSTLFDNNHLTPALSGLDIV